LYCHKYVTGLQGFPRKPERKRQGFPEMAGFG
jgi:hypothetical protein